MSDMFKPAPEPPTELGRYRVLARRAAIRVSPLQLGAMSIGKAWSSVMGSMDKDQSFKLLDAYYEAGGNFIDTANLYQDEESEEWIGEWLEKRGCRDTMVLATKFTSHYKQTEMGAGRSLNFAGNSKRSIHMSLRDSLKKLRTDYIDILYLHWWDHTASIEEVMDALDIVVKQGKVLYLGVSDTPAWIVSAANYYAMSNNKTPFVIYQGRWNVMLRDFEREILPMARHFGMALAPWDVIGGGKFQTQKMLDERKRQGEELRQLLGSGQTEEEARFSEALNQVASEHGIESPTAVALAYVMAKAPNVFPIIGGRKVEHLHDNLRGLELKLTHKQIDYLESIKPFDPGFPSTFVGPDPKVTGQASGLLGATGAMSFVKSEQSLDAAEA